MFGVRWLLNRLQKRRCRRRRGGVEPVDNQHLPLTFDRRPTGLHDQRLSFLLTAKVVASRVEDVHIGMTFGDGEAAVALRSVGISGSKQLSREHERGEREAERGRFVAEERRDARRRVGEPLAFNQILVVDDEARDAAGLDAPDLRTLRVMSVSARRRTWRSRSPRAR